MLLDRVHDTVMTLRENLSAVDRMQTDGAALEEMEKRLYAGLAAAREILDRDRKDVERVESAMLKRDY